jgi:hypothetical protein
MQLSNPAQDRHYADAVRPRPEFAQVAHLCSLVKKFHADMERKRRLRDEIRAIVREELTALNPKENNPTHDRP